MTKHKTINDIVSGWNEYKRPEIGDMFKHYKGDIYEIVTTGFIETTLVACVVYRSTTTHVVWVRTAQDFFETVKHAKQTVPRFTHVT
ncbi:MAG: DUF1653 domain-containing protein [Candidatus Saccharimonadales bacterium]